MEVNLGRGIVSQDTTGLFAKSGVVKKLEDLMFEDILQVRYPHEDVILDVGWYPEGDVNGGFLVYLVKGEDWDNPLAVKRAKTLLGLKRQIESTVRAYKL